MKSYHSNEVPHFTHVTVAVTDIEQSTAFYQNVIGLQVRSKTKQEVTLGTEEENIITLRQTKNQNKNTIGLYHIAFLQPSIAHLANWFVDFYTKQISYGAGDHHVSIAIYFEDPEGNGIEMYADRDDSNWYNDGSIDMGTYPVDFTALLKEQNPTIEKAIPSIGHLHMQSKNINKARDFFTNIGMNETMHLGSAVFLSFDGYHHHLAFNNWGARFKSDYDEKDAGIHDYTLSVSKDMFHTISTTIMDADWVIEKSSYELILRDPNGIPLYIKNNTKENTL